MANESATEIRQRFAQVKANKVNFESQYQEISDNVIGRRDHTTRTTPGRKRMTRIFDSTAMDSSDLLAAGLDSFATNPATRWFTLVPTDRDLLDIEGVSEWFQFAEDTMYSIIHSPAARFTAQMHELYRDLVNFATACMFVDDVPGKGILFSARPIGEIFISENAQGIVDEVFRRFYFTAKQAVQEWGEAAVPEAAKQIVDKNAMAETEYIHWVRANDTGSGKPWLSTYVSMADTGHDNVVSQGDYFELPYMTPRWSKDAGEVYGRGVGLNALPQAKMVNELKRTILTAAELSVRPPLLAENNTVISPLLIRPGVVLTHKGGGSSGRPPIEALKHDSRVDIGLDMLERERAQIRTAFYAPLLEIPDDPRMTATQVIQLSTTRQRLFSPILARLQGELLNPMLIRVFNIAVRTGRIVVPEELQGIDFDVEYMSPVARAQKKADSDSVVTTVTAITELAQSVPSALDILDVDEVGRLIGQGEGSPLSIFRSPQQVEQIRVARAQQQAEAQEMAVQQQQAETAATLAPLQQGQPQQGA